MNQVFSYSPNSKFQILLFLMSLFVVIMLISVLFEGFDIYTFIMLVIFLAVPVTSFRILKSYELNEIGFSIIHRITRQRKTIPYQNIERAVVTLVPASSLGMYPIPSNFMIVIKHFNGTDSISFPGSDKKTVLEFLEKLEIKIGKGKISSIDFEKWASSKDI